MTNLASGISSKYGPAANEHRARSGSATAAYQRRIKGGLKMERHAIKAVDTHVVPVTHVIPENEHDAAEEFSAVILPFSRGELARAGKRGKYAAKRWKDGQVLPSAWTMMHLAREIPTIRNWIAAKMGISETPEFLSPEVLTLMMAGLYRLSLEQSPDGDAARTLIPRMAARGLGRK